VRIGQFAEAEVLQALEVDFIDESEVLTPARRRESHLERTIIAWKVGLGESKFGTKR